MNSPLIKAYTRVQRLTVYKHFFIGAKIALPKEKSKYSKYMARPGPPAHFFERGHKLSVCYMCWVLNNSFHF